MATTDRQTLAALFNAALESVDPYEATARHADDVARQCVDGHFKGLYVLSFGKAASAMARAVMDHTGMISKAGIVITKYDHADNGLKDSGLRVYEAGHPIPDEKGFDATREALRFLEHSDKKTLIVCLISGGGSSLLVAPYPTISLKDKQVATELLLNAGADIFEMNAVRKHISRVKGGRLAAIAYPSRVESLILSDVLGDRLDVIASGPTAPDGTTYADALDVIGKYGIAPKVPTSVLDLLRRGNDGLVPETPKENDRAFGRVSNRIVGNNSVAIEAAKEMAERIGFEVMVVDKAIRGEAREVGRMLAGRALALKKEPRRRPEGGRQLCLISGGETTVTVRGRGKGGRNMELALAFAIETDGEDGITFLSAGTDGGDGPTDAAGAIVDGFSASKGRALGIDPGKYLQNNDSYNYFRQTNELLMTGPTGTNVMDVQIALLNP